MTPELAAAWEQALALWRVRLADPVAGDARTLGSFAAYSMPPRVHIDLDDVARRGISAHLGSVLAHEVGHHVLAPATRLDSLKITHQMARALEVSTTDEFPVLAAAAFLGNLWCDMLINTRVARLQRTTSSGVAGEPDMITLWRALGPDMARSLLGWVVMRAYEHLWSVPAGDLGAAGAPPVMRGAPIATRKESTETAAIAAELSTLSATDPQADALMLADAVRTFETDPVTGALTAGLLLGPYLDPRRQSATGCGGGTGEAPPSAAEVQDVLRDPRLQSWPGQSDADSDDGVGDSLGQADQRSTHSSAGQAYGLAETIALYTDVPEEAVMAAWYRTQAQRWVRPLHEPAAAVESESIPGPRATWEIGEDIEDIDWAATLELGPTVIPGVTTRRIETIADEPRPEHVPVQLDLYMDSSGSMRAPRMTSPAALAATILVESVLRGGGRVRVTSFSGAGQVSGSVGYTRDRAEAMSHVLAYFGGGTTFPLDLLERRYLREVAGSPRRKHLVVLSDDGMRSFFGHGQEQFGHVAPAVGQLLDSGTIVLVVSQVRDEVQAAAAASGYEVVLVPTAADALRACAALAERLRGVAA